MIDFIRTYPNNKYRIESKLENGEFSDNVKQAINPVNGEKYYSITSNKDGVYIEVDEYRAYVNSMTKIIYNSHSSWKTKKKRRYENLSISNLKTVVENLKSMDLDIENHNISQLHISLIITTQSYTKNIINRNIFLHKTQYYNHNRKQSGSHSNTVKEFVYTNYSIEFQSINPYSLKVILKLKKKKEFKCEIKRINDLLKPENLELLFNNFLKRFDEVIIIDNFNNIDEKDKELLDTYTNYRYWIDIKDEKSKQTKSRHFKKFKSLILKHQLNKQKLKLRKGLIEAFEKFKNS